MYYRFYLSISKDGERATIKETGPNNGLSIVWAIGTVFFFFLLFMLLLTNVYRLYLLMNNGKMAAMKQMGPNDQKKPATRKTGRMGQGGREWSRVGCQFAKGAKRRNEVSSFVP